MPEDQDAIMKSMRENSIRRLNRADGDEQRSVMAFQSGQFGKYWLALGKEVEERVEAENARIEAEASGGDAGETGGGESGNDVPPNGGDSPPQPPEEELPPAAGT